MSCLSASMSGGYAVSPWSPWLCTTDPVARCCCADVLQMGMGMGMDMPMGGMNAMAMGGMPGMMGKGPMMPPGGPKGGMGGGPPKGGMGGKGAGIPSDKYCHK